MKGIVTMKKILCAMTMALAAWSLQSIAYGVESKAADAAGTTAASSSCEDNAVGKDGKKLAGAAKTSFMKKCEADAKPACEAKAIDKNGKKLAGAAKTSFMKKCEADAKPAK
jgi:hypothetical protein